MSIRNLKYLFRPTSVAVVGASKRPHSVGSTVMKNLLAGGFDGPIMPVHPRYDSVAGVLVWPNVGALPRTPDLAIICTPPATVPGLIAELGERGTKAAVVLTAGLDEIDPDTGKSLQQMMLDAARCHTLRLLGPNCLGLVIPPIGLNASFAHDTVPAGSIAFISQSGALATAVLDWARTKDIGFSHFISLGNSADIDFGDALDFLGSDPNTRSILVYIESVKNTRKFMSAARAAARNKPVIALKTGRVAEGAKAAASHTGALAGSDDVYDAAIRRAGMLRVFSFEDLFDAVETLGRGQDVAGDRLVILTNGGGPGVMATDVAISRGVRIAELSDKTMERLNQVLPATWSKGNPIDIIGDAPSKRYVDALKIVSEDRNADAILLIHAPSAIVSSSAIAKSLVPTVTEMETPLFSCWLGGDAVAQARQTFAEANIPTFETPEAAVNAFVHLVDYRRNQETLMETPAAISEDFTPDIAAARQIIKQALEQGRDLLTEPEAKGVLSAFGVPVVATRIAATPEECVKLAAEIGYPVAIKILSPDISHKSDVGGVALDLESNEQVEAAATKMLSRIRKLAPDAELHGFTVQAMARRPEAHELIVGASEDPIFGPIVLFGQGGTAVEVIADRAVALPPLNVPLAKDLIARTRVSKLLAGYRDRSAADMSAIHATLIQVSQLVAEIPEVSELDINPLLADSSGVLALDARLKVKDATNAAPHRLAIRPYPRRLEEQITFAGQPVVLRPIRPEDEPAHLKWFLQLQPEDIRFRFLGLLRELVPSELARFTQIDYEREMAFIATRPNGEGQSETLGVARVATDPDNVTGEFAIIVRSDLKGKGLGSALLEKLIRYCRQRGTSRMISRFLPDNTRMLGLMNKFGFEISELNEDEVLDAHLDLSTSSPD